MNVKGKGFLVSFGLLAGLALIAAVATSFGVGPLADKTPIETTTALPPPAPVPATAPAAAPAAMAVTGPAVIAAAPPRPDDAKIPAAPPASQPAAAAPAPAPAPAHVAAAPAATTPQQTVAGSCGTPVPNGKTATKTIRVTGPIAIKAKVNGTIVTLDGATVTQCLLDGNAVGLPVTAKGGIHHYTDGPVEAGYAVVFMNGHNQWLMKRTTARGMEETNVSFVSKGNLVRGPGGVQCSLSPKARVGTGNYNWFTLCGSVGTDGTWSPELPEPKTSKKV